MDARRLRERLRQNDVEVSKRLERERRCWREK